MSLYAILRFLADTDDLLYLQLVAGIKVYHTQQPSEAGQPGSHLNDTQQHSGPSQQRPPRFTTFLAWIITVLLLSLVGYFVVVVVTFNPAFGTFSGIVIAVLGLMANLSHTQRTFNPVPELIERFLEKHLKPVLSISIAGILILLPLFVANATGFVRLTRANGQIQIGIGTPGKTVSKQSACFHVSDAAIPDLSYGNRTFDAGAADSGAKIVTAQRYTPGHGSWEDLHALEPDDAETSIYAQDQRVVQSNRPYFTLVLPTSFVNNAQAVSAGTDDNHLNGASRDLLRGASVEQALYNKLPDVSQQMFLMIANIPNGDAAQAVEDQIIQAQCFYHIVGLIGWPYGADVSKLNAAHIPVVSPNPLSENEQGLPFLFSVAPSVADLTQAMAAFAGNNQSILVYDRQDNYSRDIALAPDLRGMNSIGFDPGSNQFFDELNADLDGNPGLKVLYFVGYPLDAVKLLSFVEDYQSKHPGRQIIVLGSNTLYQDVNCPPTVCPPDQFPGQFKDFYYVAFAFADERSSFGLSPSAFFSEFSNQFDPDHRSGSPYYHGRPDSDAILAYDATMVLAHAFDTASATLRDNSLPSSDTIRAALLQITRSHALLGASGQISFRADGSTQQKPVIVLHILQGGRKYQSLLFGSYCGSIPHCIALSSKADVKGVL
jgi:hypothetical protein